MIQFDMMREREAIKRRWKHEVYRTFNPVQYVYRIEIVSERCSSVSIVSAEIIDKPGVINTLARMHFDEMARKDELLEEI